MIEVEKKFILTDEQEKRLLDGAEFLGEKNITDTYYDDTSYSLTRKDLWLRKRDASFELKIPMNVSIEERVNDCYRELETDKEIAAYLKLSEKKALAEALTENGYAPFVTIVTTRRKYKKDGYNIDLDSADFGYRIAEIECMVEAESEIHDTGQKIIQYAKTHGLSGDNAIRGKVAKYLERNNPAHLQALIEAKVVK